MLTIFQHVQAELLSDDHGTDEKTFPYRDGEFLILGPEVFTNKDETTICWKGVNYFHACDAFIRKMPDGGASYCIRQFGHEDNYHIDFTGHCTRELTYIDEKEAPEEEFKLVTGMGVPVTKTDSDAETKLNLNGEVMVTLNVSCSVRDPLYEAMDVLLSTLSTLVKKEGINVSLSLYDSRDN